MQNKVMVVAGPTAVGKTKYSIELAKKINGEIVSLDSVQVYKYLDIGSGKVTKEEMEGIPHYMIDVVEPTVNLNVKEFKDMATNYINDILSRGKTPILVGGTGFYIRAVLYDTDFLEEDEQLHFKVRTELYDELDNKGIEVLYNRLKEIDFESYNKIPIGNVSRIIRALEFYKLHNFPISKHNFDEKNKESKYNFEFYVLNMDREKLYERIDKRVDKMIENGLLLEVKKLIDLKIDKNCNAMKSIGYKELYDFCLEENNFDIKSFDIKTKNKLSEKIELIKKNSRNYAKRQLTWFRSQKNIIWVDMNINNKK